MIVCIGTVLLQVEMERVAANWTVTKEGIISIDVSAKYSARSWFGRSVSSHIYIILADSVTYRELGYTTVIKVLFY